MTIIPLSLHSLNYPSCPPGGPLLGGGWTKRKKRIVFFHMEFLGWSICEAAFPFVDNVCCVVCANIPIIAVLLLSPLTAKIRDGS